MGPRSESSRREQCEAAARTARSGRRLSVSTDRSRQRSSAKRIGLERGSSSVRRFFVLRLWILFEQRLLPVLLGLAGLRGPVLVRVVHHQPLGAEDVVLLVAPLDHHADALA